jgi:hypothetical protein
MKDRPHDEAIAEQFRADPPYTYELLAEVRRDGNPADLAGYSVAADGQSVPTGQYSKNLKPTTKRVIPLNEFDPTEFTFANGIFCDVKERLCLEDRYDGANG